MNADPRDAPKPLRSEEHRACLGLGSNIDPERNLPRAIGRLGRAMAVEAFSTAWESPAVGADAPNYINAALLAKTAQTMEHLLEFLKEIETELGRVRGHRRASSLTIDIDLLVFDQQFLEDDLWSQAYRAVPLAELLPDLCSPATGETIARAAARLAGSSPIKPRADILAGLARATRRSIPTSSARTPTT